MFATIGQIKRKVKELKALRVPEKVVNETIQKLAAPDAYNEYFHKMATTFGHNLDTFLLSYCVLLLLNNYKILI